MLDGQFVIEGPGEFFGHGRRIRIRERECIGNARGMRGKSGAKGSL
jgi:hypothetical protein